MASSSKNVKKSSDKKYNELPLEQKVKLIKEYNASGSKESYESLAQKYKIGKSSVGRIIRNSKTHLADLEEHNLKNKRCRRLKKTENSDLNVLMKEWFDEARGKSIPISGPLIQEQALEYAKQLGLTEFKASKGWLVKWRECYNITSKTISGESADADIEAAEEFKAKIPEICRGYAEKDIYNLDETGLFIKGLPNKSLVEKGGECKGGKFAKDRLTVLAFCNQDGSDKRKLLVIGKAKRPRSFKNVSLERLPVTWEHNKKAWMTRALLEPELRKFDREMTRKKRKVLLFMDNAASHKIEALRLKNVKIVFFPPNVTSQIQPLDLGIIRMMKAHYKKKLLQKILANVQNCNTPSELLKTVSLLDSVYWIAASWDQVPAETIQKCFRKAGFIPPVASEENEVEMEADDGEVVQISANSEDEEEDEIELYAGITQLIRKIPNSDLNASEFVDADNILPDSEGSVPTGTWSKDLLSDFISRNELDIPDSGETSQLSDSDGDPDEVEILSPVSHKEAEKYICLLRAYSLEKQPELVGTVMKLESEFGSLALDRQLSGRQSTIDQFFPSNNT